ncbi:MAG: nucleotidyl transferase AbiEii/AbiGii toxin family protein [Aeromicrobium sp.]|uniref:nucleotidyl transferase AbiEii/AbiGii toxin family protein n=1 Tax=Aeromicrobium sp. TaxID=1871063 RepID=UPI0039E38123
MDSDPTRSDDDAGEQKESDPVVFEAPNLTHEQQQHVALMLSVAQQITRDTGDNFVLKGGTALLLAYGLPRHSTDLDFDGRRPNTNLTRSIERGALAAGATVESLGLKKDTPTTKRYMLHYGGPSQPDPLKIETSFRQAGEIDEDDVTVVDGFRVYKIERLAALKIDAFLNREKGRDVFDVWFLLTRYPDVITDEQAAGIRAKVDELGEDGLYALMENDSPLRAHDLESIVLDLVERA